MTRRTSIVEQVSEYFAQKGAPMTADEYKSAEDAPVRFQLIKRNIGSWSRLLNMVNKSVETPTVVESVVQEEVPVEAPVEPETPVEEPVAPEPEPAPAVETKKPTKG
jgi:hypothetical protein